MRLLYGRYVTTGRETPLPPSTSKRSQISSRFSEPTTRVLTLTGRGPRNSIPQHASD